jgi:hypothetical protein
MCKLYTVMHSSYSIRLFTTLSRFSECATVLLQHCVVCLVACADCSVAVRTNLRKLLCSGVYCKYCMLLYHEQQSPYSVQFRNGTVDVEARNAEGFQPACKLYHTLQTLHLVSQRFVHLSVIDSLRCNTRCNRAASMLDYSTPDRTELQLYHGTKAHAV